MSKKMSTKQVFFTIVALIALTFTSSCDQIDNKSVPNFTVRINLGDYARWTTYGVNGVGDYRIFNREKGLPKNFPYDMNTWTGFGGVLLMMGIDGPMAYDLSCPVEATQNITLSIDNDNFEAVCPSCGSRYNPLTGAGGPVSGVAINNKVGMRQYRANPSNGGYLISN